MTSANWHGITNVFRRWRGALYLVLALLAGCMSNLAGAIDATPDSPQHCVAAGVGFAFEDSSEGATVAAVFAATPSRQAGLLAGDIVRGLGAVPIGKAAHLAAEIGRAALSGPLSLRVERGNKPIQIIVEMAGSAPVNCVALEPAIGAAAGNSANSPERSEGAAYRTEDRGKAIIAVGGFEVKAAKASSAVGDGLREMMVTALHNSGYFVVVERINLKDLTEGAFAAGRAGDPTSVGLDVAELVVFAAITEFEPTAGGSSFMNFMPGVPLAVGAQISYAELALDMRVVDVATGRVLAAQRVPGMARSARGTISAVIPLGAIGVPAGLEMYRGTPMEWAVRDCIHKASLSIANTVPLEYFRHR